MRRSELDVAVLGGSIGGLAAAHWLVSLDCVQHVELFERQTYENKGVQCGEAINDATLVPLQKTPENGFINDINGYELRVFDEPGRRNETEPLTTARFDCPAGYICERDKLERRWAETIAARGVRLQTGENISPSQA